MEHEALPGCSAGGSGAQPPQEGFLEFENVLHRLARDHRLRGRDLRQREHYIVEIAFADADAACPLVDFVAAEEIEDR